MKIDIVLITFIPFIIIDFFSEEIIGNEKKNYQDLCHKYKMDKHVWIKGFFVVLFISLSIPCFITMVFYADSYIGRCLLNYYNPNHSNNLYEEFV